MGIHGAPPRSMENLMQVVFQPRLTVNINGAGIASLLLVLKMLGFL